MRITKRLLLTIGLAALAIVVFAACQSEPETVEVVVTRVVTETIEVEGETMEVTRLVEVPVEVTAEATEAPPVPEEPKILRIGGRLDDWLTDPEQPAYVTVGMSWNNVRIFEGLTRMDENYQVQPALATSWEYDAERGVWTFQLREDVVFHDGVPMTAENVAEHFNNVAGASFTASALGIEENAASAVDEYTLEIETSNLQFPMSATHFTSGMIRRGNGLEGEHIGTGPFMFVEYVPNSHLIAETNPNYWGGETELDGLEIRFMPDPVTRMLALQAGDVDVIFSPSRESLSALEGRDDIILYPSIPTSHQQLDLNVTGEDPWTILQDPLVREAIGYAVNRQELVEVAWGGFAVESQTLVAQALLGDNSSLIEGYTYDPERSIELLEEAGWLDADEDGIREKDGRPLSLRMVNGWPNAVENGSVPEVLQAQLAEVGIEMEIVPVPDFPTLASYLVPKTADIFLEIWTSTNPDPCQIPNFGFYGGGEEPNIWQAILSPAFAGFEEVNEEIENCRASTTQDEAKMWTAEVLHTVFDQARTAIGLVGLYQTWATTDEVSSFTPHPVEGYVRWEDTQLAE